MSNMSTIQLCQHGDMPTRVILKSIGGIVKVFDMCCQHVGIDTVFMHE